MGNGADRKERTMYPMTLHVILVIATVAFTLIGAAMALSAPWRPTRRTAFAMPFRSIAGVRPRCALRAAMGGDPSQLYIICNIYCKSEWHRAGLPSSSGRTRRSPGEAVAGRPPARPSTDSASATRERKRNES